MRRVWARLGHPGKAEGGRGNTPMKQRWPIGTIEESMIASEGDSGPGRFADRPDAGRQLAARLLPLADEQPLVLGLPRGGVPVAAEVAARLGAPLEILAVRK